MPVWIQEAIASISMLIFFVSMAVLASGEAGLAGLASLQFAALSP